MGVPEESRWWYWIAAYPIYTLLSIPLLIAAAALATTVFVPVIAVEDTATAEPGTFTPLVGIALVLLVGGAAVYALAGLVLTIGLPVALYLDAKSIADSTLAWDPDPVLYGLVGVLNFLAAPFVGVAIAAYYLYRRRQHVGTP